MNLRAPEKLFSKNSPSKKIALVLGLAHLLSKRVKRERSPAASSTLGKDGSDAMKS